MRLYIENWSDGRLVPQVAIQELINKYTFGGTPEDAFRLDPADWRLYPSFTELLSGIVVPEPIYVLKLRPAGLNDVDAFEEWVDENGLGTDTERRVYPGRIGTHTDIYGFHLRMFVAGDYPAPLTPENIAGYKTPLAIRDEIKEFRSKRERR